MTPGKLAAQAGHAYLDSYLECRKRDPPLAEKYLEQGHGTKVALQIKSLDALLLLHQQAIDHGLPCALITDSGHIYPPYFDGSPIVTALGIGPAYRHQIHHLTKKLALVR